MQHPNARICRIDQRVKAFAYGHRDMFLRAACSQNSIEMLIKTDAPTGLRNYKC